MELTLPRIYPAEYAEFTPKYKHPECKKEPEPLGVIVEAEPETAQTQVKKIAPQQKERHKSVFQAEKYLEIPAAVRIPLARYRYSLLFKFVVHREILAIN